MQEANKPPVIGKKRQNKPHQQVLIEITKDRSRRTRQPKAQTGARRPSNKKMIIYAAAYEPRVRTRSPAIQETTAAEFPNSPARLKVMIPT